MSLTHPTEKMYLHTPTHHEHMHKQVGGGGGGGGVLSVSGLGSIGR